MTSAYTSAIHEAAHAYAIFETPGLADILQPCGIIVASCDVLESFGCMMFGGAPESSLSVAEVERAFTTPRQDTADMLVEYGRVHANHRAGLIKMALAGSAAVFAEQGRTELCLRDYNHSDFNFVRTSADWRSAVGIAKLDTPMDADNFTRDFQSFDTCENTLTALILSYAERRDLIRLAAGRCLAAGGRLAWRSMVELWTPKLSPAASVELDAPQPASEKCASGLDRKSASTASTEAVAAGVHLQGDNP